MSSHHPSQGTMQFPPPVQHDMVPQVSEDHTDTDTGKSSPQVFSPMYHIPSTPQSSQRATQSESSVVSSSSSSNTEIHVMSSKRAKIPKSFQKRKSATTSSALDALAFACAVEQNFQPRKRTSTCSVSSSASSAAAVSSDDSSFPSNKPSTNQNLANEKVACDPQDSASSSSISHNDVLCGRGGLTNHHPGNIFFRRMVRLRQESYLRASKRDKASVARDIVDTIRQLNPPGRFLKKGGDVWVEIGNRKAREKTSQALREGAPELREELIQLGGSNQLQSESQNSASGNMSIFTEEQRQKLQMEEGQKRNVPFARAVSLDDSLHGQIQTPTFVSSDPALSSMQLLPHLISDERQRQTSNLSPSMQRSLPMGQLQYPDENKSCSSLSRSNKRQKTEFCDRVSSNNTSASEIYVPTNNNNNHQLAVIRPNSDEESSLPHSLGRRVGGPRLKMLKNRMGSTQSL